MDDYQPTQRALQDRFDTRRLADRLAEATGDTIAEPIREFIERQDHFFLATADEHGAPQCSYKGGDPGFVQVLDESTIAFPVYNGNGMFLSAGNIEANPQVALLFVDFETGSRLRFNGTATIDDDVTDHPGAQFMIRVQASAVFANCRRYVHRYQQVEHSAFVPSEEKEPPVPDWKLDPWFEGTLPADDPAHDPDHPVAPAIPHF